MPSASRFTPTAVQRVTREWLEVLQRDASHPSIVTWVPLNESWGVPSLTGEPAQRQYVAALAALTRAVDPTRLVVSNDGWEHVDSDIVTVHDYHQDAEVLQARYGTESAAAAVVQEGRPWRRRICLVGRPHAGRPVMLSEFGGISSARILGWGYGSADDDHVLRQRLELLFHAVRSSASLAGFCYTQLTDTATETNGLLDAARHPKLAIAVLRAMIEGEPVEAESAAAPIRPETLGATGPTQNPAISLRDTGDSTGPGTGPDEADSRGRPPGPAHEQSAADRAPQARRGLPDIALLDAPANFALQRAEHIRR